MTERHCEDYTPGHVRESFGRTITEADIVLHAGQTGDHYPHHMDEEWCKTQPFGQRIAHGTLTFSVVIGLTAGEINPHAMTYGYERLRFPKPVFIGDTVKASVEVTELRPEKNVAILKTTTTNQDGRVVVEGVATVMPPKHA